MALVHFTGRFDQRDPTSVRFDWPGAEIVARFVDPALSIELTEAAENRYAVIIDDAAPSLLVTRVGRHVYPIADGLSAGSHEVTVTRRTESPSGATAFHGFPGAALVPSEPRTARLVEIVGDSISCGYGVLGTEPTCEPTGENQSEPDSYGALAASALGAAHRTIARSGRGMYRNSDGGTDDTMPDLFARTLAGDPSLPWEFSDAPPAVVVINLGTNDFASGDPGRPFVDAYDAFVRSLRERYPSAHFVVALSPMLYGPKRDAARGYLRTVVDHAHARGDDRVSLLEFDPPTPDEGYGCHYHPSAATQRRMASALAAEVRCVTGW